MPSARQRVTACLLLLAALTGCVAAPAAERGGSGPDTPQPTSGPAGSGSADPSSASAGAAPTRTLTAEEARAQRVAECVRALPRDVRIGQTMLVTTPDLARVQGWLDDGLIAGLLANGRITREVAGRLELATSGTTYGALLVTDDEGGEVQRYREVLGPLPSARQQARTMTPEQARSISARYAGQLADWGVDLVLAPVVDIGAGPGIGSRSFGDDPALVTTYAAAAAAGFAEGGVTPVLKHFPGHGRASGDSHDSLVVGPSIDDVRRVDLSPYRALLEPGGAAVLVGHTIVPGLSEAPASQSSEVITGLLRDELGYDGLVLSDALGMAAAGTETQGEALVGFIAAGGDLGIVGPGGSVEGRRAMRAALADGTISKDRLDEAALRVLQQKGLDPCTLPRAEPEEPTEPSTTPDPPVVNPTEES